MKLNHTGSINKNSVSNTRRVAVGRENYTLDANLQSASRKVKIGEIAVLPGAKAGTTQEWLKSRGEWIRVEND